MRTEDHAESITTASLQPGQPLPLVIEPDADPVELLEWATRHRAFIETHLRQHGGILFRRFAAPSVAVFEQFMRTLCGALLAYTYRSTPRRQVHGHIYTSTEYPADQAIPLHNEEAYAATWPRKIAFFCVRPAAQGGETPIADSRNVFARIAPDIRERFMHKQVMYVRNYGDGVDLSWENVFQTRSKADVEAFCQRAGIAFEWKDGHRLRTR